MAILLTNIDNNTLNEEIINESYEQLKKLKINNKSKEIKEIIYLNEKNMNPQWNLNDSDIKKFQISLSRNMEDVYDEITDIITEIVEKKEFINVIVDTSFLAYIILEILIKKFDITEVFIIENNQLKKAHPCGCDASYMGF